MTTARETAVAAQYARPGLFDAIIAGLAEAGADLRNLRPEDLAPVDEFHTAGRATTLEALDMTPIAAGMHVLDAGSGLGGTARCLARERGCRVTGIDLTPEYVDTARRLTDLMDLADACTFHVGSAVGMPFDAATFDAGVSFHTAMNIEDRAGFYAELARVLRPGAPLCLFDVMQGPEPGIRYPVPWAADAATSFLKTRDETCALLRTAGFEIVAERNLRPFTIDFFRTVSAKAAKRQRPPPLGLHLLTGASAAERVANYAGAVETHQVEPVILVAERGGGRSQPEP